MNNTFQLIKSDSIKIFKDKKFWISSLSCVFIILTISFFENSSHKKVKVSGVSQKTSVSVLASVNIINGNVQGSGTIISKGSKYSLLVSAGHNFKENVGTKFWVYYPDGSYTQGTLLAVDRESDLSLSQVDSSSILEASYVPKDIKSGPMYGVGYTNGQGPNYRELKHAGYYWNQYKRFMWNLSVTNGYFWDGDSGAGIFMDDYLIGVTSERDAVTLINNNTTQKRMYACSHHELLIFLNKHMFNENEYGSWSNSNKNYYEEANNPPVWKPNPNIPLHIESKIEKDVKQLKEEVKILKNTRVPTPNKTPNLNFTPIEDFNMAPKNHSTIKDQPKNTTVIEYDSKNLMKRPSEIK